MISFIPFHFTSIISFISLHSFISFHVIHFISCHLHSFGIVIFVIIIIVIIIVVTITLVITAVLTRVCAYCAGNFFSLMTAHDNPWPYSPLSLGWLHCCVCCWCFIRRVSNPHRGIDVHCHTVRLQPVFVRFCERTVLPIVGCKHQRDLPQEHLVSVQLSLMALKNTQTEVHAKRRFWEPG